MELNGSQSLVRPSPLSSDQNFRNPLRNGINRLSGEVSPRYFLVCKIRNLRFGIYPRVKAYDQPGALKTILVE